MKTMRSEIIIDASAEEVWVVLVAFSLYPEWNLFLRTIIGNASEGEQLRIKAKVYGLPEFSFRATISTCASPVKLGWNAIFLKGVFEAYHYFEIQELGPSKCRFIHTEEFRGILCKPVLFILESTFRNGYRMMNEALKERVGGNSIE
jgi:hypothetical protein